MRRMRRGSTTEAIYRSIVSSLATNHHSPSVREIATIVGCSISTVHRHLLRLERLGLLRRRAGLARALIVIGDSVDQPVTTRAAATVASAGELHDLLADQAAAFERRGEFEAAQVDERLRVHEDVARALQAACFHGYALGVRWAAEQLPRWHVERRL